LDGVVVDMGIQPASYTTVKLNEAEMILRIVLLICKICSWRIWDVNLLFTSATVVPLLKSCTHLEKKIFKDAG